MKLPDFTPASANESWHSVEVEAVRHDGNGDIEAIREPEKMHEAEFYSVYVRLHDGRAMCVADLHSKELAESLAELLITAAKNFIPMDNN